MQNRRVKFNPAACHDSEMLLLLVPYIIKGDRGNIVHGTTVPIPIEDATQPGARRLRLRAAEQSAEQSAEQPAQAIGSYALLLFLPSEITHNYRRKHHKDLGDLPHAQSGFLTDILGDPALAASENMTEYASRICRRRRGCRIIAAKDHTAESADVVEDAAIVVFLQGTVQAPSALWCGGVICEPVDQGR